MQKIETDIVIIGTGLAGLSLAKYLSEQNPNLQITGEFNNLMQQMINFIFVELWKNYAGD